MATLVREELITTATLTSVRLTRKTVDELVALAQQDGVVLPREARAIEYVQRMFRLDANTDAALQTAMRQPLPGVGAGGVRPQHLRGAPARNDLTAAYVMALGYGASEAEVMALGAKLKRTSPTWLEDRRFMLACVAACPAFVRRAGPKLSKDLAFLMAAVRAAPTALAQLDASVAKHVAQRLIDGALASYSDAQRSAVALYPKTNAAALSWTWLMTLPSLAPRALAQAVIARTLPDTPDSYWSTAAYSPRAVQQSRIPEKERFSGVCDKPESGAAWTVNLAQGPKIQLFVPNSLDKSQATKFRREVINVLAGVPRGMLGGLRCVIISANQPDCFENAAKARGQMRYDWDSVLLYPRALRTSARLRCTLTHELAHNWWKNETEHAPSLVEAWKKAMQKDGVAPTGYAKKSELGEDVAETVAIYLAVRSSPNMTLARKAFAARFAILERLLHP